jgi:hypothetical protein
VSGLRASVVALVAALLLAGCGGGSDDEATAPTTVDPAETQTATTPASAPQETQTVTVPESAPPQTVTQPAPTPTQPEEEQGGAGDEEGIQVPARFVLKAGGALEPDDATVPAFLGTAVIVENSDSAPHRLEVGDRGAQLPAGRTTTLNLPGRGATELPILIDGNQAGILRVTKEKVP